MRIGVFGGSFDPVHLGHLVIAEMCREQAGLDEVWFLPSATAPHKPAGAVASPRQRKEMLEFAIAGHGSFRVSDLELKRGGTSFTVETLRELHGLQPDDRFFLILGSDSLAGFPRWREPAEICRLASLIVYLRPGSPLDWEPLRNLCDSHSLAEFEGQAVEAIPVGISSSGLRKRIADGLSVRYLVPRSVEKYIQLNQLYARTAAVDPAG